MMLNSSDTYARLLCVTRAGDVCGEPFGFERVKLVALAQLKQRIGMPNDQNVTMNMSLDATFCIPSSRCEFAPIDQLFVLFCQSLADDDLA